MKAPTDVDENNGTKDMHKILSIHDETLKEHGQLLALHARDIETLKHNATKLENTIMTENRETRQTIVNTNAQLHTLINNLMGYDVNKSQDKNKLTTAKIESIVKIIGILSGSGGLLYYIFGVN